MDVFSINNLSRVQVNIFNDVSNVPKCQLFENVKTLAIGQHRRRRKGFDSTSQFCSKAANLKIQLVLSCRSLLAELSFVTLTIHLCSGLNDKNLVKRRKTM